MRIGSRSQTPKSLPAIVAALSVALHAAVALLIHIGTDDAPKRAVAPDAEVATSAADADPAQQAMAECETNAALAAWASAAYCLSPMGGGVCFAKLDDDYLGWREECTSLLVEDEQRKKRERDKQPVRIALLDDSKLAQLEPLPVLPLLQPPKPKPKPKLEPAKPEQPKQAQPNPPAPPARPRSAQVVEITPPTQKKPPKNTRFVSEFDSAVDKQTVARGSKEEMVAKPSPKELPVADKQKLPDKPQPPKPKQIAKEQPKSDFENAKGTGKLDMRRPGEPEEVRRKPKAIGTNKGTKDPLAANGLAPKFGERRRPWHKRKLTTAPRGQGGEEGERGRPKVPDLRPSEELLSRVVGGGSVDKLDDVQTGDTTALNSKRWKYATFFNRMKRQVVQNWHPNQVYMARDPTGKVYGVKDRRTVVRVSLRRDGSVAGIHVIRGSGVSFLDDEAVKAFRVSGPFPNPPVALIENGSDVITFNFSFTLEISGSSSRWRIRRYR